MARNSTHSMKEHDDTRTELETAIRTVFKYLYADNQWYRLPKVLHKITPIYYPEAEERRAGKKPKQVKLRIAAYTLAAMLNQANVQDGHDGWFKFSTKKTEEDTGFCRKTQYNHIYFLQRCKLVYCPTRAKEVRGRREVKINYLNLYRAIQAVADSGVKVTQAAETSGVNLTQVNGSSGVNFSQAVGKNLPESCRKKGSERKEKERTVRIPASRVSGTTSLKTSSEEGSKEGKSPRKKSTRTVEAEEKEGKGTDAAKQPHVGFFGNLNGHGEDPAWIIAAKLADLLIRQRKTVRERIKLAVWAKQINKGLLPLIDNIDEVLKALVLYEENINDEWWPTIQCADTLCKKWPNLQKAVLKAGREDGPKNQRERFSFDRKQRDDDPRYRKEYI